jgi:hypothetical protein
MAQVRLEGRSKTADKERTYNEGDSCESAIHMLLHVAVFLINIQKINCVVIGVNVQDLRFHQSEGQRFTNFE